MALISNFKCISCKQNKYELVTQCGRCASCRTAEAEAAELAHMHILAQLPLEERVRRIELQLYKLNAEQRLQALEIHHVRY